MIDRIKPRVKDRTINGQHSVTFIQAKGFNKERSCADFLAADAGLVLN